MRILYLLIIAALFCSTAYNSFGKHVDIAQESDTRSKHCELRNVTSIISCTLENGAKLDVWKTKSIPAFGICTFLNGTGHTSKQCTESGAFEDLGSPLLRRRRFEIIATVLGVTFTGQAGAIVAGAIGVGFIIGCIFLCFQGPAQAVVHNVPPYTRCSPEFQTIFALKGQDRAMVEWTTRSWDTDGEISKYYLTPSNTESRMTFENGNYTVTYTAIDNKGAASSCDVRFEVKVITCQPLKSVEEMRTPNCDPPSRIYGSKCYVSCNEGYSYPGPSNVFECQSDGKWNLPEVEKCKANQCQSKPSITNGSINCNGTPLYGDFCSVTCNPGYSLVDGSSKISCNANGTWETTGTCKDSEPPKFIDCPNGNIVYYIDSPNNTASVTWNVPTGTDNSGITPTITERNKYIPGMRFMAGTHIVHYDIKDSVGNVGNSCQLGLHVETISCDTPSIQTNGSEHLVYSCSSHRFGAYCNVSCNSGYPHGGAKTIYCLNEGNSDPPKLKWEWDMNEFRPYCAVIKCPKLRTPKNGALACADWTHGKLCQIQCDDRYDVAYKRDGGYFVCGESDGLWRPDHDVYDCSRARQTNMMHFPSKLYYYTGHCNSSKENLQQIQDHFMGTLPVSAYKEFGNHTDARARFVKVTCGRIVNLGETGRLVKRATTQDFAYIIEFDLIIPYKKIAGQTDEEAYTEHQDALYDLIDAIKVDVDSGRFNIHLKDLDIEAIRLEEEHPKLTCNPGEIAKPKTGSCVGCPPGNYYSAETEECIDCDMNTFQDESNAISCKPCPEDSVTTGMGSKTSRDCIEICVPGSFSHNGLAPCQLCPSSSYQPAKKQTSCLPCDKGSRTSEEGSTNADDCLVFDLSIDAMKPAKIVFDRTAEEITMHTWLHLQGDYENQPTFEIVSSKNDFYMEMTFNTSIKIDVNGSDANFQLTIPTEEWTPVVLTISGRTQTLGIHATIDGSVVAGNKNVSFPEKVVFKNGDIFQANPGIIISNFHIWDKLISSSEIEELLSTCTPDDVVSTYSLSDFVMSSGTVSVIIPSLCDAINECTTKPCGEHTCINKLGGYECKCHGGFTGKNCEIPKDYCLGNACLNNASCINGQTDYTCRCLYGYRGSLCGIKAVDGGWSIWTEWTACSKTCGGGFSNRERYCNSPSPDPEGSPCEGSANETIVCNSQKCPECIRLATTSDVLASCNETGHSTRCTIYCRPGLFFASPPLPIYECGRSTKYIWNHQTEENPTGRLPPCTEAVPPTELGVSFDGHYEFVTCTPDNVEAVKSSVGSSLSSLECVQHGSCSASIMPRNCLENEEQLSNGITFTVELKSTVKSDGSGYNLAEAISNNAEPSSDLITFLKNIIELEKSAQILMNDSKDLFEVTVNGETHTVMKDEFTFSSSAKCLPGSIRLDAFCAECPVGAYSDGEEVIMCPIGLYQDEKGQTSCKQCPSGYTTYNIGSASVSECFEITRRSTVDIRVDKEKVLRRLQIVILRCTRNCRDLRNLKDFIRTCLKPCRKLRNKK